MTYCFRYISVKYPVYYRTEVRPPRMKIIVYALWGVIIVGSVTLGIFGRKPLNSLLPETKCNVITFWTLQVS